MRRWREDMTSIEDPEFLANLFYRKCYWHADELATQARQDHRPEVWRTDPTARILAEVTRLVTVVGQELEVERAAILKEAVEDAVAKRRPRW